MTVGAALLFGNARYEHLSRLATPLDDIENLGNRAKALGFDTYVIPDASLKTMSRMIEEFRRVVDELPKGSSVFVYFGGHGVQRSGENFLLPVDCEATGDLTLATSTISLTMLLDALCWREDQQKLIAIDACRTNHIPSISRLASAGLSDVSLNRYQNVRQTKVLFATHPGWVASDGGAMQSSPFCRGLLEAFKEPERPLFMLTAHVTQFVATETAGSQIPWENGSMTIWGPFVPSHPSEVIPPMVAQPEAEIHSGRVDVTDDHAISASGHLVHKLKAKDTTGRWAYYFILVQSDQEAEFLAAIEGDGTIDLEDYGFVVASSYGETPSDETKAYLKSRYGFDV